MGGRRRHPASGPYLGSLVCGKQRPHFFRGNKRRPESFRGDLLLLCDDNPNLEMSLWRDSWSQFINNGLLY